MRNMTAAVLNRATLVIPPRPRGRNRPPAAGGTYTIRLVPGGGGRGSSAFTAGPYSLTLSDGQLSVLSWDGLRVVNYHLRGV